MFNRMNAAKHIHIDETYIHPPNFMYILIILYIDIINNIRAPSALIIMNRKTQELYERIFKSIKYLITANNKKGINQKTATIDFENALLNSFGKIFPNIKIVFCLFHYKQALIKRTRLLGLYKKEYKNQSNLIINKCGAPPFKIDYDKTILSSTINEINEIKGYAEFGNYLEDEWSKYIKFNGLLDYHKVSKSFRLILLQKIKS